MKKNFKFVLTGVLAFTLGLSLNNIAMSDVPSNYKIGVVNVQKVIESSSKIKAANVEQGKKVKELQAFVVTARKAVAAEKDTKKKQALEAKYNKELNAKKNAMDKALQQKLEAIDKEIATKISAEAKAKNYNIVLAKGVVLYGGNDMTASIVKAVK